jgi:hypothetical protein
MADPLWVVLFSFGGGVAVFLQITDIHVSSALTIKLANYQ